jgi:hypothetical protein
LAQEAAQKPIARVSIGDGSAGLQGAVQAKAETVTEQFRRSLRGKRSSNLPFLHRLLNHASGAIGYSRKPTLRLDRGSAAHGSARCRRHRARDLRDVAGAVMPETVALPRGRQAQAREQDSRLPSAALAGQRPPRCRLRGAIPYELRRAQHLAASSPLPQTL